VPDQFEIFKNEENNYYLRFFNLDRTTASTIQLFINVDTSIVTLGRVSCTSSYCTTGSGCTPDGDGGCTKCLLGCTRTTTDEQPYGY